MLVTHVIIPSLKFDGCNSCHHPYPSVATIILINQIGNEGIFPCCFVEKYSDDEQENIPEFHQIQVTDHEIPGKELHYFFSLNRLASEHASVLDSDTSPQSFSMEVGDDIHSGTDPVNMEKKVCTTRSTTI